MAHSVDGFQLKFTGRTSWKAERRERGKLIDVIPITWTKGTRPMPDGEILQEVWYQDASDMEVRLDDTEPFVVALAEAKDFSVIPHSFKEFRAIYEVVATGRRLSDSSIETRILRRLRGGSGGEDARRALSSP